MKQGQIHYLKKRSRRNFAGSTLSIAFVLLILGIFAIAAIWGSSFANRTKESIVLKVFLHDQLDDYGRDYLLDDIRQQPYVLEVEYVSKEQAGEILMERTGEDVKDLLGGDNPLMSSINIRLKAQYIQADSLDQIKTSLTENTFVADVVYPLDMILRAGRNIQVITLVMVILAIILTAIALFLILGTIRMSIFARRYSIRSMQLVGATTGFIRQPFLWSGFFQGILGGLIASGLLFLLMIIGHQWLKDMGLGQNFSIDWNFIVLFGGIVLFGSILGLFGSYLAVNKYLHKNLDELT